MSGRSIVAQEINRMLDKIRVGINKAYQDICDRDNYVTAEKVRNAFLGMGMKHETLLAVFRQHNYATTVCLSNDVPIETLSKMLGHRSIRTTQIYAKITAEKVSRDMDKLSKQIEQMENFICQAI